MCIRKKKNLVQEVFVRGGLNGISPSQHRFVPKRWVSTNLVQFVSECLAAIDDKSQIDAIYTDFMSAFDRTNHDILLAKLSRLSFNNNLVTWLKLYLNQRSYSVKINKCLSDLFDSSNGVIQGSNIGSVLFILFINDIVFALPNQCLLMYGDDVKIYATFRNYSPLGNNL